ncbi:hypothetical protein VIGAN_03201500 [Vigna angularis var. angularis]|uniref:Uncharacterized protein n=1 Tax=Vigna angularis var. angularis TaxID=157739 RepID=A0A0S3RN98_PHAAN|nr:hypothetical protein VIGAN_03201500 [Vigna angularis var. angularis]
MPSQLNKDLNETLQSILDKLANLQIQLNTTQENHDGGYIVFNQVLESRQTALETMQNILNHALTTLLSILSSHSTTIPLPHDMAFNALHISSSTMSSIQPQLSIPSKPFLLQQPPQSFILVLINHISVIQIYNWKFMAYLVIGL